MTAFTQLLVDEGVEDVVQDAREEYLLARALADEVGIAVESEASQVVAAVVESLGLAAQDVGERVSLFTRAFILRRDRPLASGLDGLLAAASLAADGVLANRSAEVLMLLRDYLVPPVEQLVAESDVLSRRLLVRTVRAFVLLVRRSGGWEDIRAAAEEISLLRQEHQRASEATSEASTVGAAEALQLVSGFNLAKIVDLTATFTASGQPANVQVQFERHAGNRNELGRFAPDAIFGVLGDLIQAAAGRMIQTSIWTGTTRLGKALRDFVGSVASPERPNPLLELWPSQRAAIDSHLLDPARRAVVVEMPTSAGKTLIAEFSIIQAHALNPDSTVVYVVPTRALVNQITQRLRQDFAPLNLVVEAAVPVFELDPTEDSLLRSKVDILVSTPEKLDLLIKAQHPTASEISLVVVDEAHNIADGVRGARLELLLGLLKRERAETRFLLLTPFVPNADQLASWLGDGTESTIAIDWRPSERIAVTGHWVKPRGKDYRLNLTTVASAGNVDVESGRTAFVGKPSTTRISSKAATTVELVGSLSGRGGVLVLARGKGTSETRAEEIASHREARTGLAPFHQAVIHFAGDELGADHLLPRLLERGVAYHHAGLSHDLRYLIEALIDGGHVDVVVGTTTLAQGLNFPISSVIVETLTRTQGYGQPWKDLTYSEFWNIAGRAGRAMRDPLGLVAFPCVTRSDREEVADFLRGEAAAVASALLDATAALGDASSTFNLAFTRQNPDLAVFLQYLTHVARVGGADQTASEIEDVLRSSLVFHQASDAASGLPDALLSLARGYVRSIEKEDRGFLALADGTGFSLASARLVYGQTAAEFPEFRASEFWSRENLFHNDPKPLADVITLLGGVPELKLGLSDSPASFDPAVVAGVTRDWVSGADMTQIADRWFTYGNASPSKRLRDASAYVHGKLVGQIPWGIGAMQKLLLPADATETDAAHIPSFVFYGVSSWQAVLMRMGGVPRRLAHSLGESWAQEREVPNSFAELREWISRLSPEVWRDATPQGAMSGDEAALIWRSLTGSSPSTE
ncbi:RAD3-like DEAD/DEAH box helicase [Microbacterium sp. SLBN-154]|uniref:DEAD/DEAH box helicase n=1 Tax=Microbacterium sp. SLBN-154 TaxID=2768458 RepID=UPI00114E3FDE|nr:DEAD/DEAH box helicase [Microbacterium sp. SLBN-154]TQK20146.1 RAD3-like DEAD/DEAH box helicase [Microbacterium sp. SLBN-154]